MKIQVLYKWKCFFFKVRHVIIKIMMLNQMMILLCIWWITFHFLIEIYFLENVFWFSRLCYYLLFVFISLVTGMICASNWSLSCYLIHKLCCYIIFIILYLYLLQIFLQTHLHNHLDLLDIFLILFSFRLKWCFRDLSQQSFFQF